MLTFVSSDVRRIGSVSFRGWLVVAWRVPLGYRLVARRGTITKDTMVRPSLPQAWRVLRPHLTGVS